MRCNVGIGTNRFLAKMAASLHKPDGLDVITHQNLREVLGSLELQDLTGVAVRNEHRLNAVGIYTPLQMLDATPEVLRLAFGGVVGEWWHQRLRGWEVDKRDFPMRTIGRQYVLERFDLNHDQVLQRLHNLCESVGFKLRSQGKQARGVFVYAKSKSKGYWRARHMASVPFSSNQAIYSLAAWLFQESPSDPKEIGITCYGLVDEGSVQLYLWGDELAREVHTTEVIDKVNARYGDRTIHSVHTLGTGMYVKQKIPFGSTRYL